MKTSLILDDDVAAALERLQKDRNVGFEKLANDVLRRGLNEMIAPPKNRGPFRTRSVALGRTRLSDTDNVVEALAVTEGKSFK
jgi:hypothetical protein